MSRAASHPISTVPRHTRRENRQKNALFSVLRHFIPRGSFLDQQTGGNRSIGDIDMAGAVLQRRGRGGGGGGVVVVETQDEEDKEE